MAGLFATKPPPTHQRLANDRHRHWIPALVLAFLALYAYLFSGLGDLLGIPRPGDIAARWGAASPLVFAADGYVHSDLAITTNPAPGTPRALLGAFFAFLAAAFLSAYYLPLPFKRASLALWAIAAMAWLYGPEMTAGLMAAHLGVYLVLHPESKGNRLVAATVGVLARMAFWPRATGAGALEYSVVCAAAAWAFYKVLLIPALRDNRFAPLLRRLAIHSPLVWVAAAAVYSLFSGPVWRVPLGAFGAFLFLFQWQRLWMYSADYQEGLVPKDLPLWDYLPIYWTPATIPNQGWGFATGQGYSYLETNYLCEDKNKIVLEGLRIWAAALFYLALGPGVIDAIYSILTAAGLSLHGAQTSVLVDDFVRGSPVGAASVLTTTSLSLLDFIFYGAGITHFKVGIWRVLGYRMDPEFDRPWMSTNLASFWSRYLYHYRCFLVRIFYYPVFFGRHKLTPALRLLAAALAAATFANWLAGHLPAHLILNGLRFPNVVEEMAEFPYFLLLGVGIAGAQWFALRHRHNRRAWSLDRWLALDVLSAYVTWQYFALILIFARLEHGSTLAERAHLFACAFGLGPWAARAR